MAGALNPLRSICIGIDPKKDTWRVKVRVLRVWDMFPVGEPSKPYAIHVVLIDVEGVKIEGIIKKGMLNKFRGELVEGSVYRITYFNVISNSGAFRATEHGFKIVFNSRTKVVPDSGETIPTTGLSLKHCAEIGMTLGESDFLIDMIGLVTAVSTEKNYAKDGQTTRKIELELTDDKGKIRCALFGNYVDIIKEFLDSNGSPDGLPVAVIQYAKIKLFRGNVVLQNVMNATKVLWNPEIPEVASFRVGLSLHGINPCMPLGDIDDGFRRIPMDDEFLKLFPRKTLHELHSTEEEGMFIVLAKITGLVDGEKWWYSSCQCHKSVTVEDGMFRCNSCSTIVLEVIPRFRIKVEVSDLNESAIFVLFDFEGQHILQSSCKQLVVSSKDLPVDEYPDAIKEIVGKEFLFKVEKSADHGVKYDDSFKVKKICDVSFVIEAFKNLRSVQTPKKSMTGSFISKFSSGSTNGAMSEESGGSSGNLSEIGPSPVSLDDISTGEDSCVVTSGGSAGIVDTNLSKPAKRMRLRNNKADNI